MQLLSEKSKASVRLTCILSSPFFKSCQILFFFFPLDHRLCQILLELNSLEVYWAPTMLMKGGSFSNHFSGEMPVESRTVQTTLEPCLSSDLWLQRYQSRAMLCLTVCFFFLLIHCCCFKDLCIIKGGFPKSPPLKMQPECMLLSWSQCVWRYYYCWCYECLLSVHYTWDTVLSISKSG